MHSIPAAAHEAVKRRPIGLAKIRQRGLSNLRVGLTSPCRENHAPVGRRKQVALATPVTCQGLHVNSLYQDRRRKASPEKNLNFRAARAPESVCKGKESLRSIGRHIMKKTIVILACLLIAPLAFAQTGSKHKRQTTTTTEQPIVVTGTIIPSANEQGAAAGYQPAQTLVINVDGTTDSHRYVLAGPGH